MAKKGGASFEWESNTLTPKLLAAHKKIDLAILAVMMRQEGKAEEYMRQNAPWTDRTSNARNGLRATSGKEGKSYVLTMYHSMPYGIWLEIRFSGRYAVIVPSLPVQGSEIMRTLTKVMEAMT